MTIDTSAIVAIFRKEPGWDVLLRKLLDAPSRSIGAPTLVETVIVLTGNGRVDMQSVLAEWLQEHDVSVLPFGLSESTWAAHAFVAFGKGRHPAALNLGDCQTYGVARANGEPLLCKGDDFPRTDLTLA